MTTHFNELLLLGNRLAFLCDDAARRLRSTHKASAQALMDRAADWRVLTDPKNLPNSFAVGDHVRKKTGSQWQGYVVGTYATKLTQEGYAVESESHLGSVQIYPASALELVP